MTALSAPSTIAIGDLLEGLSFEVTYTTLAMDVAGTRDLYPIHHDPEFARAAGVRDIFLNTMWYQAFVGRYLNEWGGPESFLRRLKIQMSYNSCPGDTLTIHATVTGIRVNDEGLRLVDLDVAIGNGDVANAVTASATLELATPLSRPNEGV